MKRYTIEQIIEAVRIKYNEHPVDTGEMITVPDDFELDTVVMSNIVPAYHFAVLNADISMLEGKSLEEGVVLTIDDDLIGHLQLPDDFLRGVTARLSSWKSSPRGIIEESSPEYRMQSDPYACGTPQQPVLALVHTSKGKELEFFKAKEKTDKLRSFVYIPSLSEEDCTGVGNIDIPDQLAEPFIYYIAALTATTFREDVANDFFKVARSLLVIE